MADIPKGGTPTAQDDVLGEATRATAPVEGLPPQPEGGADGRGQARQDGEARPGRDENQAGFLKDADKRFSP